MNHRSNRPVDWEALVTENENRLYRAALAMLGSPAEAEDAVQDTFLRYLEKAPDHLDSPPAWLMRVLVNRCRDLLRARGAKGTVSLMEEIPVPGPEERQELEELYALPLQDRAVIHLYYYEGWSAAQVARILGLRESTVRSRLFRARGKLKQLLIENNCNNI